MCFPKLIVVYNLCIGFWHDIDTTQPLIDLQGTKYVNVNHNTNVFNYVIYKDMSSCT